MTRPQGISLSLLVLLLSGTQVLAEEERSKPHIKVRADPLPTAKEGLVTYTYVGIQQSIDKKFDKDGNEKSLPGMSVDASVAKHSFKMGFSKGWSMHLDISQVNKTELKVTDEEGLLASEEYGLVEGAIKGQFAQGMLEAGSCADMTACMAAIEAGAALPTDNSAIGYSSGTPITSYAAVAARQYFANEEAEAEKGLSDTELAVTNHQPIIDNLILGTQLALTIPTGKWDVEDGELARGDGRYSLTINEEATYSLDQASSLTGIASIKQDLTSAESNGTTTKYEGLNSSLLIGYDVDLGGYLSSLDFVSLGVNYKYSVFQREVSSDDNYVASGNVVQQIVNARMHGFNYGVPLILDYLNYSPMTGKNINLEQTEAYALTLLYKI
ncbi:MAG: hypothetical protein HRU19_30155 [Pseudobacteriovorax sp.]|nr:hypothetical protein [Pseudobacteriovorax sp.]